MIEPGSIVNTDVDKSFYDLLQPKVKNSTVITSAPKHHLYTPECSEKLLEKVWGSFQLIIYYKPCCFLLQILEVPVHTMPPVRLMCDAILRSMVLQKNAW